LLRDITSAQPMAGMNDVTYAYYYMKWWKFWETSGYYFNLHFTSYVTADNHNMMCISSTLLTFWPLFGFTRELNGENIRPHSNCPHPHPITEIFLLFVPILPHYKLSHPHPISTSRFCARRHHIRENIREVYRLYNENGGLKMEYRIARTCIQLI